MAGIKKALRSLLAATPEVAALVGDRIHPRPIARDVGFPRLMYFRVSGQPEHSMEGVSGLDIERFQVEAHARTEAEAEAIADAVRTLDGFRGSVAGTAIQHLLVEDFGDVDDPPTDGGERPVHRAVLELNIAFSEE